MRDEILARLPFADKFYGCLFSYARASGEIVGAVAHEGEQVDDLGRTADIVFLADLFLSQNIVAAAVTRLIHLDERFYKLSVVFVRREHECLYPAVISAHFIGNSVS